MGGKDVALRKSWIARSLLLLAIVATLLAVSTKPAHAQQGAGWHTYGDWLAWPSFSVDQADLIFEAHALAVLRVEEALRQLKDNRGRIMTNKYKIYSNWFGAYDETAYRFIHHVFQWSLYALNAGFTWDMDIPGDLPQDWFTPEWITFSDSFAYFDAIDYDEPGLGAFVLGWQSVNGEIIWERNQIYIGWGFFLWSEGDDPYWTREGVIVHEATHMFLTADIVYGQRGSGTLAATSPTLASRNADNYRYFVENLY
jgi:lysine-specific metallo-endopeptidase family protein